MVYSSLLPYKSVFRMSPIYVALFISPAVYSIVTCCGNQCICTTEHKLRADTPPILTKLVSSGATIGTHRANFWRKEKIQPNVLISINDIIT